MTTTPLAPAPPEPEDMITRALDEVPRDAFLAIGSQAAHVVGRSMPLPSAVRHMLEVAALRPGMRVLHVGTGSGYVAAVASRIASEICTIERLPSLGQLAQSRFRDLGYKNIALRLGNGLLGWPEKAPFDVILISATVGQISPALKSQVAPGGRIVLPEGRNRNQQRLVKLTREDGDRFIREEVGLLRFSGDLGDILVDMGVADAQTVRRAHEAATRSGRSFDEELLLLAPVAEPDLYRARARQRCLMYGEVDDLLRDLDSSIFESVPRAYLDHNRLIPLSRNGERIRVATCDPDARPQELQKAFPGAQIDLYLVTPTNFRRLWATIELVLSQPIAKADSPVCNLETGSSTLPLGIHHADLLETLLLNAIGERASDLHVELCEDRVRIRLRIDGELRDLAQPAISPADAMSLLNVIKVRAQLDITEHRLPQGGRIQCRLGGDHYDLRVQTQPALHGEHVVIRLLRRSAKLLAIEDLGLPPEVSRQYRRLLDNPAGLILVVGPTGSGKSTTLYAGLQLLSEDSRRKVITIEDPIEYSIEGIQQTQVRPDIGFAFAHAMRAFVREDPDVILVGEIRDAETALEAIRASQTGHVVLSTLHANDSTDALQRLFDLGAQPNSIASELLAVLAQRLARRVCDGCRQEVEPDPQILAEMGQPRGDLRCFAGKGCARCRGRGTHGRIAVVEFLPVHAEMRRAICRTLPVDDLRKIALSAGLITMRDSALQLVRDGIIPLSELPRILPAERMVAERID